MRIMIEKDQILQDEFYLLLEKRILEKEKLWDDADFVKVDVT